MKRLFLASFLFLVLIAGIVFALDPAIQWSNPLNSTPQAYNPTTYSNFFIIWMPNASETVSSVQIEGNWSTTNKNITILPNASGTAYCSGGANCSFAVDNDEITYYYLNSSTPTSSCAEAPCQYASSDHPAVLFDNISLKGVDSVTQIEVYSNIQSFDNMVETLYCDDGDGTYGRSAQFWNGNCINPVSGKILCAHVPNECYQGKTTVRIALRAFASTGIANISWWNATIFGKINSTNNTMIQNARQDILYTEKTGRNLNYTNTSSVNLVQKNVYYFYANAYCLNEEKPHNCYGSQNDTTKYWRAWFENSTPFNYSYYNTTTDDIDMSDFITSVNFSLNVSGHLNVSGQNYFYLIPNVSFWDSRSTCVQPACDYWYPQAAQIYLYNYTSSKYELKYQKINLQQVIQGEDRCFEVAQPIKIYPENLQGTFVNVSFNMSQDGDVSAGSVLGSWQLQHCGGYDFYPNLTAGSQWNNVVTAMLDFKWNFTNQEVMNNYTYSDILPAGSFYWKSYANTTNGANVSSSNNFLISKNNTSPNLTVTMPTSIDISETPNKWILYQANFITGHEYDKMIDGNPNTYSGIGIHGTGPRGDLDVGVVIPNYSALYLKGVRFGVLDYDTQTWSYMLIPAECLVTNETRIETYVGWSDTPGTTYFLCRPNFGDNTTATYPNGTSVPSYYMGNGYGGIGSQIVHVAEIKVLWNELIVPNGTASIASCSYNTVGLPSSYLYRNDSSATVENNIISILPAGIWNYVCNGTNQNYTSSVSQNLLIVPVANITTTTITTPSVYPSTSQTININANNWFGSGINNVTAEIVDSTGIVQAIANLSIASGNSSNATWSITFNPSFCGGTYHLSRVNATDSYGFITSSTPSALNTQFTVSCSYSPGGGGSSGGGGSNTPVCGNHICEYGENAQNCFIDCSTNTTFTVTPSTYLREPAQPDEIINCFGETYCSLTVSNPSNVQALVSISLANVKNTKGVDFGKWAKLFINGKEYDNYDLTLAPKSQSVIYVKTTIPDNTLTDTYQFNILFMSGQYTKAIPFIVDVGTSNWLGTIINTLAIGFTLPNGISLSVGNILFIVVIIILSMFYLGVFRRIFK